jgi:hypothetical protein
MAMTRRCSLAAARPERVPEAPAADAVRLPSLGIEVALAGIYAGVTPGPPS